MLLKLFQTPTIHQTITAPESYRPGWTARHREIWDGADPAVRDFWVARGERHLDFQWPSLESMYSDYQLTGNRTRFEAPYHKRRQVLATFVFAEAFENRGRFIPALLDAIGRVCEEPTWVLPAHGQNAIDLFSAETANLLAWALYLFGGVPEFRSAPAIETARRAVQARVLDPYLTSDCWWMSLNGHEPSNWTTWCTSNCLGIALLLETDIDRRRRAVERACLSLDRFTDAYKEDGGCDEGPMYWNFAAGCLFDSLEMLFEASGGAFDVFANPVIRNIGEYIGKMHVHDLQFVNFADCPPQIPVDAALMYRFGRRINSSHMQQLGAHLYRLLDRFDPEDTLRLKVYRTLSTFAGSRGLRAIPGSDVAPRESYLPHLQVAVAREHTTAGLGLVLAAKGGHNNERHNHNDIGNVVVYLDGRPAVIDIGLKQYTKDSFSSKRYEIWVMQSGYHNVPLVNGCMQTHGARAAARDARFDGNADLVWFGVDIAGAYPAEARLVSWRRECILDRVASRIRVQDEFEFDRGGNSYEQRFMTAAEPRIVDDGVVLRLDTGRAVTIQLNPKPARITRHEFSLTDGHLRHAWGGKVYQVRFGFDNVGAQGRCEITISPASGNQGDVVQDIPLETLELP